MAGDGSRHVAWPAQEQLPSGHSGDEDHHPVARSHFLFGFFPLPAKMPDTVLRVRSALFPGGEHHPGAGNRMNIGSIASGSIYFEFSVYCATENPIDRQIIARVGIFIRHC